MTRSENTRIRAKPENLLPVVMETAVGIRTQLSILGMIMRQKTVPVYVTMYMLTTFADAHVKSLEYITEMTAEYHVNLGSQNGISVKEMVQKAP